MCTDTGVGEGIDAALIRRPGVDAYLARLFVVAVVPDIIITSDSCVPGSPCTAEEAYHDLLCVPPVSSSISL